MAEEVGVADGLVLSTHHAKRGDGLAVPHDHAWDDRMHGPLAALDPVDMLGIDAERRAAILQHDAGFRRHYCRPEP